MRLFTGYNDVRIIADEQAVPAFERLGEALASLSNELILGTDFRQSGAKLAKAIAKGFGKQVAFAGALPTPAIAWSARKLGVAITASHNPREYNGAKFFREKTCFLAKEMHSLQKIFGQSLEFNSRKAIELREDDEIKKNYVEALPEIRNGVFDLCGGAVCAIKEVFPKTIYSNPDAFFELHNPDPAEDELNELRRKTIESKEIGFAFDGDGDRVVAVDGGKKIPGDVIACFVARNFTASWLETSSGSSIPISIYPSSFPKGTMRYV